MSPRAMGGHQSAAPQTTTWLTPPHIIAALGGPDSFDLDPCGFPGWPTARRIFCLPQDGLAEDWGGPRSRAYVNPPYTSAELARWLARLADHGRGSALIFARTETEAFQGQVFERASGLLWLRGRLFFHWPSGDPAAPCMGAPTDAHEWIPMGPPRPKGGQPEGCARCGVARANSGAPSVIVAYGEEDLDRLAASGLPGRVDALRFPRFILVAAADAAPETWREVILAACRSSGGAVNLSDLYRQLACHPKARGARHWRPKVRQTLQRMGARRVAPSSWELVA